MCRRVVAVRSCEHCIHAAFDDGGVYCKRFAESILQPTVVALECGEFEHISDHPFLSVVSSNGSWVPPEAERMVRATVELPYYGSVEHGTKLINDIGDHLRLQYGDKVRLTGSEVR
jgi:hypothetical protein